MSRTILILLLVFSGLMLTTDGAYGCVCGMSPTVYAEFAASDVVFVGKPISSRNIETKDEKANVFSGQQRIYKIEVQTNYKGLNADAVEVNTGNINTDCSSGFSIGESYLIYADSVKGKKELRSFQACGLNDKIKNARDQISIINWILKNEPEPQLYGSLEFSDENDEDSPLKNVRVQAISEKTTVETVSDENGVFKFPRLAQGNYAVKPLLPETQRVKFGDSEAIIITTEDTVYTEKFADDIKELAENFDEMKSELKGNELKQFSKRLPKSLYTKFYLGYNYGVKGRIFDKDGKPMKCRMVSLVNTKSLDKLGDLTPQSGYVLWNAKDESTAWKWCDDEGNFSVSAEKHGKFALAIEIEIAHWKYKIFFLPNSDSYQNATIIDIDRPKQLNIDVRLPISTPIIKEQ